MPQPQKVTPALTPQACEVLCKLKKLVVGQRGSPSFLGTAVMPFALAASFLTAAPVSCKPTSFSRPPLHCITLRSFPTRTFFSFGLLANTPGNAYNHKLHSLSAQHSLRCIPFHSVLLHSVSLQSTRCPCCARLRCRSGCGLSCFLQPCICWPTRHQLLSTKARHLP